MRLLRKLLKLPLAIALRNQWFRSKAVHELRANFYGDLAVEIPLSHGMSCPVARAEYIYSFSEIFLNAEYGGIATDRPLPRRWLDLGCHAGYFSLYVAWQLRRSGVCDFSALLIDADPRVTAPVNQLIEKNGLRNAFFFECGLLKSGAGNAPFALREGMGSSADLSSRGEAVATVQVLAPETILRHFPPPYDLVKIDIEGGEYDLAASYGEVLRHAGSIILEWHSWDREGSGEKKIRELMARHGFELREVFQQRKHHLVEGRDLSTGCHYYTPCVNTERTAKPLHAAVH